MKSSFKDSENETELVKHKELKTFLEQLSLKELKTLQYDWQIWARDDQLPPSHLIPGHKAENQQAWNDG